MNATVPELEESLPAKGPVSGEADAMEAQKIPAEPPMAWHRFLTNFWLWLAAVFHGVQAGWILWGGQYYTAEIRNLAYAGLPGLRMLDWALAAVAIAAAALYALSALHLRKRRNSGPRLLCWAYILLLAGQLGLAAGRWFIIGLTPLSVSTLGPMAVYLALLLVNGSYYRRRRAGFMPRNQMGGHVS